MLVAGVLALTLAACGAPQARPPPPHAGAGSLPASGSGPARGRAYRIDTMQSELRVLVYRAGPLARLGHNHVMVNRSLRGEVDLPQDVAGASFHMIVPADAFMVDDAEARREEGADFAGDVPDDAKAGTLGNMLSPAVLDAAEFPEITVQSLAVQGQVALADESTTPTSGSRGLRPPEPAPDGTKTMRGQLTVTVTFGVTGHEVTRDVPVSLLIYSGGLAGTGVLRVRQSELGVTPYSLMLGALQVQDEITIRFKIVAVES
jgi:YceI-like protein